MDKRDFEVRLGKMTNTNEIRYYVSVIHPNQPVDAAPWDEGRMDVFSSTNKAHAEQEKQRWQDFFNFKSIDLDSDIPPTMIGTISKRDVLANVATASQIVALINAVRAVLRPHDPASKAVYLDQLQTELKQLTPDLDTHSNQGKQNEH